MIPIEVIYALAKKPVVIHCQLPSRTTVFDAIKASGILLTYPIDIKTYSIGIYGKLVTLDQCVQPGDRIEIYQPLVADPKEIRRRRANKQKQHEKM